MKTLFARFLHISAQLKPTYAERLLTLPDEFSSRNFHPTKSRISSRKPDRYSLFIFKRPRLWVHINYFRPLGNECPNQFFELLSRPVPFSNGSWGGINKVPLQSFGSPHVEYQKVNFRKGDKFENTRH